MPSSLFFSRRDNMCEYSNLSNGQCNITKNICPYVYFCNKKQIYKRNSAMPSNCKIKESIEIPKGYYKVCFERRGKLYISVNDVIEIVSNPYNFTPIYIKMTRMKNGNWKIKDAK